MRSKVSAFAFIAAILWTSHPAVADPGAQGPIDFASFMQSVNCGTDFPAVDPTASREGTVPALVCRSSGQTICTAGGAKGCPQAFMAGKAQPPFQTTVLPATTADDLKKRANADAAIAAKAAKSAETCCSQSNSKDCPLLGDSAAAVQDHRSVAADVSAKATAAAAGKGDPNDGANRAAKTSTRANTDVMRLASGVTGACNAFREMCVRDYGSLISDIKNAACAKDNSCADDARTLASNFERSLKGCQDLSSKTVEANAHDAGTSADQADKVDKATGSGDGSKSDTAEAGGGAGGMSPMSMLPMAMGIMQQMMAKKDADAAAAVAAGNPTGLPTVPGCEPGSPYAGCQVAPAAQPSWDKVGTGELRGSQASDSAGFASLGDGSSIQPASLGPGGGAGAGNNPITTKGVQGGGGGGVPGAGGSSSASLGGGGGGAGAQPGGVTGKSIEIKESSHGGYSTMAAGMTMQPGGGGGGGGYNYGAGAGDGGMGEGLRLADFLPGGRKDPGRNIAAIGQPAQIQSKSVNIWTRITEHIRSRCAQGLLRDCGPQ